MTDLLLKWIGDSRERALHVGFAFGFVVASLLWATVMVLSVS